MKTLPNNLIDLLKIAVKDLKKCKADPKYNIEMGLWHEPERNGKCSVCIAGAIIAKTLKTNIAEEKSPHQFRHKSSDIYWKLVLIDKIRCGTWTPILFEILIWDIPNIDLQKYNLEEGNLDEWEKLIKDLKDESK